MNKRTITALIGVPILVLILVFAPKICTAILFAVATVIGAYEILWRTGLIKFPRLLIYSCIAAACVCIWSYLKLQYTFGLLIMVLFTVALFSEVLFSHGKLRIEKLGICYIAGIVVPFLLAATVRIITFVNGRYLVFIPFVLSFLPDIGAYFVGTLLGSHKLCPNISPNKTVEGALGSLTAGVGGMLLYSFILESLCHFQVDYLYALLYGIVGALASIFGDLMFSAIKRQTGIKDYSGLLPGHGGIMDRLDSMVIVAPLVEFFVISLPVAVR